MEEIYEELSAELEQALASVAALQSQLDIATQSNADLQASNEALTAGTALANSQITNLGELVGALDDALANANSALNEEAVQINSLAVDLAKCLSKSGLKRSQL